jgi:hypothetical protein
MAAYYTANNIIRKLEAPKINMVASRNFRGACFWSACSVYQRRLYGGFLLSKFAPLQLKKQ